MDKDKTFQEGYYLRFSNELPNQKDKFSKLLKAQLLTLRYAKTVSSRFFKRLVAVWNGGKQTAG